MPTAGKPFTISAENGVITEIIENADGTLTLKAKMKCQNGSVTLTPDEGFQISQLTQDGSVSNPETQEPLTINTDNVDVMDVQLCESPITLAVALSETDEGLTGVAGVEADNGLLNVGGASLLLNTATEIQGNQATTLEIDLSNYLWAVPQGMLLLREDGTTMQTLDWEVVTDVLGRASLLRVIVPGVSESVVVELDFCNQPLIDNLYALVASTVGTPITEGAILDNLRARVINSYAYNVDDGTTQTSGFFSLNGNTSGVVTDTIPFNTVPDFSFQADVAGYNLVTERHVWGFPRAFLHTSCSGEAMLVFTYSMTGRGIVSNFTILEARVETPSGAIITPASLQRLTDTSVVARLNTNPPSSGTIDPINVGATVGLLTGQSDFNFGWFMPIPSLEIGYYRTVFRIREDDSAFGGTPQMQGTDYEHTGFFEVIAMKP